MRKFYLVLIFLLIAINCSKASEIKVEPTLKIKTLDGNNFDIKEKRGKVIIVNFWAKWCLDCRKELPILEEIYQKYKSQGLEIIAINIDKKRERKKVLAISSPFSYENAMFYEAKESSFAEPNTIPANYFINKDGKLIAKIRVSDESSPKQQDFENILENLLK